MFIKKILLVVLVAINSYTILAQNNVNYSLYNYSLNLVNPSFAGQKSNTEFLVNSRIQWVGISESPKTNTFSLNVPFNSGIGVGFSIINDKIFVFNQTRVALDFSYKLKFSEELDLQFGIKAQGNIYSGEINKIKTEESNDVFFNEEINKFSPNFSIGGAIVHEKYFTHLSINNILKDTRYGDFNSSKNIKRFNVRLGGGYTFDLNNSLTLKPSTIIFIEEGTPLFFDVNTSLEFNKRYQVGVSYSWNNSVQINGLIAASKWIQLGYGYSLYINDLSSHQNGTHEFMMLFNMDEIF